MAVVYKAVLEFGAKDTVTKKLDVMDRRTRRLAKNSERNWRKMTKPVVSYGKLVGSIMTAKVLSRGFALAEQGAMELGRQIVDLDQTLTAASAKFGSEALRGTEGWKKMEERVRSVGATTEFTAAEAAKGMDFLAMAGFDYKQSMEAIIPLTNLATTAQMDLGRASDIASDALGAFNLDTSEAKIQASLTRVGNVFAKTVTSSNTNMEYLFDTMRYSGTAVNTAGASIETFSALAGKLGSAGIKGSIAGTTLKNAFLRLAAPPAAAAAAIKKYHIEVAKDGKMRDMIDILGDINVQLDKVGQRKRVKALKDIFGMRAVSGVSALLNIGAKELRRYREEIIESTGAMETMADVMRTGLGVQLKVMQSALIEKGLDIFNQLMGNNDPAENVAALTEKIRDFDVKPLVEGLREIGSNIKTVGEFLWDHRYAIETVIKIWGSTQLINSGAVAVRALGGISGALGGMSGGVGAAAAGGTTLTGGLLSGANAMGVFKTGLTNLHPVLLALVAGVLLGLSEVEAAERRNKKTRKWQNLVYETEVTAHKLDINTAVERRNRMFDGVIKGGDRDAYAEGFRKMSPHVRGAVFGSDALNLENALDKLDARIQYLKDLGTGGPQGMFAFAPESIQRTDSSVANFDAMGNPIMDNGEFIGQGQTPFIPDKEQSFKLDNNFNIQVEVAGLTPGATASAVVTKAPTLNRNTLGAPK